MRVLVVEDSDIVRTHMVAVLRASPGVEVVGEARDGRTGVELCQRLRPDVVTLDMMMPGMNGLEATEHIMAHCPTPILIVSASANRGALFRTYDALQAGAVEVMEKPTGLEPPGEWEERLVRTLRLVARVAVITHPKGKHPERRRTVGRTPVTPEGPPGTYRLVVVGASTGGPTALAEVFRVLPPDFPLPIVFVLHIGEPFAQSYAEWLQTRVRLPVRMVRDKESLPPRGEGQILMAPAGRHLMLKDGRLVQNDGAERHGCRPSVDVLFESVAQQYGRMTLGVLLTGMGRDGASGMLAIRQAGGYTFAQDQESSVVYGMPKEALAIGGVSRVTPLSVMGAAIHDLATGASASD